MISALWRFGEHGHVIVLTHLPHGVQQAECLCGDSILNVERVVKAWIMAHRMEHFPLVRRRLAE